jgi:two-component system OmpR family response regulator
MNNNRILLAEDDNNLGILLRNYLTAKNYETLLFINGIMALEAFPSGSFGLCILDIMMPEMDGLTLAREIRLLNPDIPIIFLTAKNQKEDIIDGFKSGADDYITNHSQWKSFFIALKRYSEDQPFRQSRKKMIHI